ncbi:MAG TPA: hypothetical protein VFK14_12350 [Solirubrobacterales bacterium]|nr:hypothetical protein [Solirubrobacterales bacterium]
MSQPQTIELSRKEQERLPRSTGVEAALEKAIATASVQFNALSTYDKELDTALTLCGKVALSLVSETDNLILALPARIARGGWSVGDPGAAISDRAIVARTEPGLVLTLQDRAIVAWTVGTFRIKYFARALPYSSVKTTIHRLFTGRYTGMVQVEAMETWTFWLPTMFQNQSIVRTLASNFLGEDVESGATVEPAIQANQ